LLAIWTVTKNENV